MRKRPPLIEWHIAENETEWEALQARPAPETAPPGKGRYRRGAFLVVVLLIGIGGWLWRGAKVDPLQIQQAVLVPVVPPAMPQRTAQVTEQRLATPSFFFHFRQRDAVAVAEVAPRMEEIYATLRQDFALAASSTMPKLNITVSPTRTLESSPYRPQRFTHLRVQSPTLYPPTPATQADLLAQSIALLLIDHALGQAVENHALGTAYEPVVDGLRLWQLWNLDLPLAKWQPILVRWIYVGLPAAELGQPLPLPQRYEAFCAAHSLWMDQPAQLRIPLLCTAIDRSPWRITRQVVQHPPRRLPMLNAPIYLDEYADAQGRTRPASHPGEAIAMATLLDYIIATYGRDRLPMLVENLGRYATWKELAPALFGISATELETGWQQYLAQLLEIR
jgi:hypothetical protein